MNELTLNITAISSISFIKHSENRQFLRS